jgi:hypothetical protein
MRIIPSVVYEFNSDAERKLFEMLREVELGGGAVALHSQNLPEHDYKEWCEIDYVLILPEGVFALELKGGRVTRNGSGIWEFTDRFGNIHKKSEGPFDQASSGKYALKKALESALGASNLSHVSFGWGAVFPDTVHVPRLTETPDETVIDASGCKTPVSLEASLQKLAAYWFKKKKYYKRLSREEMHEIHMALRPTFELIPALSARVDEVYRKMVGMTERQFEIVDAVDESDRIICTGGAGSGKSLVAMEVARREAQKERKVAFVSPGGLFGAHVRESLVPAGVCFVELDIQQGKLNCPDSGVFDCIVVDEGQDMMNWGLLDEFTRILKDGVEQGCWYIFLDPNNQKGLQGRFEQDAFDYVSKLVDTPLKLKSNCRNTPQIILQTQLLTGADIGVSRLDGEGEKVIMRTYSSRHESATLIIDIIKKWKGEGAELSEITLLTAGPFEDAFPDGLPGPWKSRTYELDEETVNSRATDGLATARITAFKGLESKYIIVTGLENISDEDVDVRTLYTGMTRANVMLFILIPNESEPLFNKWTEAHLKLLNG